MLLFSYSKCKPLKSNVDLDKARSNVTVTSSYSCGTEHGNRKINGAEKTSSYFHYNSEYGVDSYLNRYSVRTYPQGIPCFFVPRYYRPQIALFVTSVFQISTEETTGLII